MKNYSSIRLALIVGLISFNCYAEDDMTGMDHSNMTPEQMKQMKNAKDMKDMDHSNMTPEQMKEMKGMDHDKMTPEQTKEMPVTEKAPDAEQPESVTKSVGKKMPKKVKKPSMNN